MTVNDGLFDWEPQAVNAQDNASSETTESPVKAVLDKDGIHFEDPEIISKAANAKVSNSLISGMLKCPARQAADKWILPGVLPEDPLGPTTLGSAFHRVMEHFFNLPPKERTYDNIKECYRKMLGEDEFQVLNTSADARKWVRHRVNEYYQSGFENPEDVKIAQVERVSKKGFPYLASGLELFVTAKIGDASRDTLGFIDRLSVDDDGNYIVEDWKTGKKAHPFDPSEKYADFGYVRQQILYSMIVEETTDRKVNKARLIYPEAIHPGPDGGEEDGFYVDDIPIHNKLYRKQAIRDVETASAMLDDCNESNTWPAEPSPLCSWCPLVNICPSAMKIKKQNAVDSRANQPDAGFLKTNAGLIQGR